MTDEPMAIVSYAERRVLSLLFRERARMQSIELDEKDFWYETHRRIFAGLKVTDSIMDMVLDDSQVASALGLLDEDYAPENLPVFAKIIRGAAGRRRFSAYAAKLRSKGGSIPKLRLIK